MMIAGGPPPSFYPGILLAVVCVHHPDFNLSRAPPHLFCCLVLYEGRVSTSCQALNFLSRCLQHGPVSISMGGLQRHIDACADQSGRLV